MLKKLLKHRFVFAATLIAFLFALGGFLWAYFSLRSLAGVPLIVHFDDVRGITGILIVLMNAAISFSLDERDPFLGKLFAAMTLFLGILLFIAFAGILSVN